MKRLSLLLISILCLYGMAVAQSSKFLASISVGPAIPVGKYGSRDASDSSAGWALPGPALNVSFGYHITKQSGIMILVSVQANKQDAETFNKRIKDKNGPVTEVNTTTYSWNIAKFMAGSFFNVPLSKSGDLQLKTALLAGAVKSYFPGHSYTGSTNQTGSPQDVIYFSGTFRGMELPMTFGFQVNAGIQYGLSQNIFLIADINYFYAKVKSYSFYPGSTTVIFTPGPGPFPTPQRIPFSLSTVNVMVGVEFRF